MKKLLLSCVTLIASILMTTSCEKVVLDEVENPVASDDVRITFNVNSFEQIPFDGETYRQQSRTDISKVCTYLNYALFRGDEKVKSVTQKYGDADFGKLTLSLSKGEYRLVIMAHNCNGSATISTPEKITFPDNKVTDTFYYYGVVNVESDNNYDISLKRAVAMFRMVATDGKPSDVKSMKFYYTGGSSTFDAVTGFGCVNSKQTELRTVDNAMTGKETQYEIYTFPHAEDGLLKITVTSQDVNANPVNERVFEDVPVKRNVITVYSGKFFEEASDIMSSSFALTTDDTWSQQTYEY